MTWPKIESLKNYSPSESSLSFFRLMVLVQVSATHATLKCLSPGTRPQVQSAALVDSKCAHDLSCGTPKLHKWSIDQVIVITWTVRCLLDAYKRPHIYLGIPLSLSFPSLFRRLIDSITNPPFCRKLNCYHRSVFFCASSSRVPPPVLHQPGSLHYFRSGCPKTRHNQGLWTIYFSNALMPSPFTLSSLHDHSLYDLSLADLGKGMARFDKSLGSFLKPLTVPLRLSPLTFGRILGGNLCSILLIRRQEKLTLMKLE